MKRHLLKVTVFILSAALLCSLFTACGQTGTKSDNTSTGDKEITDGIVNCFMPLTEIPRQSHHEEQVSSYLFSWAEDKGFSPTRDKQNNVLFDVPGTAGMESAPMTILQAHMDMVIAVEEGKQFDPQKDGITVINDGETITADGTSLGADDGMGVATILYLIENNDSHGPLRIIFTTDEEDGMTGASGLTSECTDGVTYVINLDSENSKEVTNSSAAGQKISFSSTPEVTEPQKTSAFRISVLGLLSGHSGLEINKGRLNGIKAMGLILENLGKAGVDYELSSLTGGSAMNAIPGKAEAYITVMPKDEEALRASIKSSADMLAREYGQVETGLTVNIEGCEMPEAVLTEDAKNITMKFVNGIFNGIYSMSEFVEGLVESSSNLGLISITADESTPSTAVSFLRSSDAGKLKSLTDTQLSLAEECGISAEVVKSSEAWPVNPDSRLLELVKSAYKAETGTDISVVQLHAGLEAGVFSKLNPALDIVSLGFDIFNPHTINEACDITTIPTTYRMLERVLANMG